MLAFKFSLPLAGGMLAAAADPNLVTVLAAGAFSAVSSGAVFKLLQVRAQNRKTNTEAAQIGLRRQRELDEMQASQLADYRQEMAEVSSENDRLRGRVAEADAQIARLLLRVELLQRGIERAHDEVIALRAQLGLGGRRHDDDPEPPEVLSP